MRTKLVVIFILSILIPTALLSYFGLLAVRSEKQIIEENIQKRYAGMADIVESQITADLTHISDRLADDNKYLESVMLGEAAIFKNQVKIFDSSGRDIGGPRRRFTADVKKGEEEKPALTRALKGLPYTIAVYERYPLLLEKLEKRKKGLSLYIGLIAFSALAILCGAFFTLGALLREWHSTELKSEFVSHLSHDLRRPLTSIRMFSEMLKEDRLPSEDKRKHYYNIITDESERLTHMANNILDFSRIERGRKKYNIKSEDISRVARDAVNHFKTHLGPVEQKINLNVEENLPSMRIDTDAILQALTNLLTNAAKFSPSDTEIDVNLRRHKRELCLEVKDRGIGIPRSEQKKIFSKFYRSSKKEIAETEGAGLGLTLVKYIAEAHHGRVRVESEKGKGSKFTLVLPV